MNRPSPPPVAKSFDCPSSSITQTASRASETQSTSDGLADRFELHRIQSGFVDGGDVLRIGQKLYVGLSTRTDAAGIRALDALVAPLGYRVIQAQLRDCLHLKTGATFAGDDVRGAPTLLYSERSVDPAQFAGVEPLAVDEAESAAANCIRVADRLMVMNFGRRIAFGRPDEVRADGEVQEAYLGVAA